MKRMNFTAESQFIVIRRSSSKYRRWKNGRRVFVGNYHLSFQFDSTRAVRGQVTVCQSYCSAIYRPTPPLFAYKRETRGGFSMLWAAPLPFLSLGNLKWSQRVNRMLLPVWFMSSWKTYPNIFAIASPRILGNFLHFEMRNTRPCMCDVTKRTSRFWFYFGKKVLI